MRICGYPQCRANFFVCVSCDRGQRYCSQECRAVVRCRQRREANRRYQQSERGQSQRDRQSGAAGPGLRYDQGGGTINSPAPRRSPTLCRCSICGRFSRWTDPFPPIPRQRRGWRDRWPVGESRFPMILTRRRTSWILGADQALSRLVKAGQLRRVGQAGRYPHHTGRIGGCEPVGSYERGTRKGPFCDGRPFKDAQD